MRMLAFVAIAIGLAGCQQGLGGSCKDGSDCEQDLFCAKAGALKGTCTASCAEQADYCEMRWGLGALCHDGYCVWKSAPAVDPCGGRCPPATTKCQDGACVPR